MSVTVLIALSLLILLIVAGIALYRARNDTTTSVGMPDHDELD